MADRERNKRTIRIKGRTIVAKGYLITDHTFSDDRIKLIETLPSGDETLVIYFRLLALACKSNAGGFLVLNKTIPYSEEMLSAIFNRSLPKIRFAMKTLIEFGMIEETEEGFKVEDFIEWINEPNARIEEPKKIETEEAANLPEPEKKPKAKREYTDDDVEMKLSKYLYDRMLQNNPEAKKPNFQSWADHIRKMINIDKRKPEQIKNMIDWCQSDSFWKGNILSTSKLRDKYDQLKVRAIEDWNRQRGTGRQAEIEDIFSRLEGGGTNDLPRSIEGR